MVINFNKLTHKIITLIMFIILLICIMYGTLKKFVYTVNYFDIIQKEAAKNNLDPYLVLAIIKTESNFDKYTISNKKAKGLMQIMESTAKEIDNGEYNVNEVNIFDENINISLGCKYLSLLIKKYKGNYYLAIIAYNAGMGNVDSWIEQGLVPDDLNDSINNNIPFKETKNYLKKVNNSYKIYRLLY